MNVLAQPEELKSEAAVSAAQEPENRRIKVMIADDHPIVREGLRKLLNLEDDIDVVGDAADGRELIEKVGDLQPDVILLDLRMPNLDGLGALQTLVHTNSKAKVIILTASEDKNEFVQAMKLGCSGIVLKQTSADLIVKSIRKVYNGEIWLDSNTTAAVMRQFAAPGELGGSSSSSRARERSPLSTREREIVALVAQGYKNKEMAEKMFISEQTVKNHLHNIFDKLGVSDRLELALYAIHKGLHLEQGTR
ncbi:MAG: response regulator transcription factor [Candidatus Solibacter usitatus]|nr:response regulator transcription factor [Candidatus Solibacter usitatus]